MKKALVTGITGQDGSYLAELLWIKDMKFTELFVVRLPLIPIDLIIFTKTLW